MRSAQEALAHTRWVHFFSTKFSETAGGIFTPECILFSVVI